MEKKVYEGKNYIVTTLDEFFGDYSVTTVDEYFRLLDKESQKRSQMVAKSLNDYLKQVRKTSKYDGLKKAALSY
ncbi:hypothetical protein IKP85_01785 [bacterium]|nr:hypothetical protein [bacterium]